MDFGILFFNSEVSTRHNVTNASNTNVYQFLIDTTKFADENGFKAVWVPERHFHSFGGLFPNPSVLAAHLAAITKQIRLRSGSVVIPLHSPISVAEEWAMVDHLSGGRVDIAFAPGWNPRDYAISPHNYPHRKDLMFEGIHVVRALWQGGSVAHLDGHKQHNVVSIQPPPKQEYLNVWVTSVGNEQTFWEAGATGANILTALLFQSAQDLGRRIEVYKKSLKYHGFDPSTRTITCMLHTYVHGTDADAIKAVDVPLRTYLADSVDLWKGEWSDLNKASKDKLIDAAFWRYINFTSLIGGVDKCEKFVKTLQDYGVTEIACLLDFGVEPHLVKESLEYINQMKNRFARKADISQTIAVIDEKHIGTPVPSRDKIIPLDKHDASIVEREVNTASSIMKIGLHIPGELNLHPGQYINIYRTTNSNTEWLSASVVSYKDNVALVYIKMTMFPLSKYFEQTAAIGDKLQVTGGHGRLCFNGENTPSEDTKCVLLAGGTGISGLYNMSNYIAKKTTHKPTLMYSARLGKTVPILHDILDANEDIEYKLFVTGKKKDEVPGKNVTRGRITKEVLRECLQNDAKSTQFYVSGPAGFVADMLIFLRELGVDQSQLHYEAIMDMKLQATLKDKNVLIVPKEHLAQLAQQAQQAQQTQVQQTQAQQTQVQQTQAQPPVHSAEQKKVEPVLPQPTPVSVTVSQDSNGASDTSHNEHAKDKKEEIKVKEGRSGSGGKSLFSIFGKKEKATKA